MKGRGVGPGDARDSRRRGRERRGEQQEGETRRGPPPPHVHHIKRNPSWTNRWKFDWPLELRLMRPKSADDVSCVYCSSSYIGPFSRLNASMRIWARTLSVIRVVLAMFASISQ